MAPAVALVHDWLVGQRGGEHVLLELARFFPKAPIYTLVHKPGSVHPDLEARTIHTSFIQHLPGAPHRFRQYLPLFPAAAETFDLSGFDLVISTSHCVAKGVRLGASAQHLAYIHTPMRYLWDQMPHYLPQRFRKIPGLLGAVGLGIFPWRLWDKISSARGQRFVANSSYVAERIATYWGQRAQVIYPPVDTDYFAQGPIAKASERHGYLVVSALVPYKRVDIAVRAATQNGWPLTVVGQGPERQRLESLAGPSVRFLGAVPRAQIRRLYQTSRGLLFPGTEDFGMVPVEAMAAGCPVVAFHRGGALETVVDGLSGVLFYGAEDLPRALEALEALWTEGAFEPAAMNTHAQRFSAQAFSAGMAAILADMGWPVARS